VNRIVRNFEYSRRRACVWATALIILFSPFLPSLKAQTPEPAAEAERPVPILTGNAGFFTNVDGGKPELVPSVTPVLLVPLGDRWLVESRAEFKGEFERPEGGGSYGGKVEQEIDYLQVDYIANRYLTVTAGRFLTPFGIYNERLYPIWIRSLQPTPLIFPLGTGSSDGVMMRGGFSLNPRVNLNYATYFSTASTVNKFESDRTAGGRVGFFLPGPRIEVGLSFQKLLQEERSNAFGFHFAWQPTALPLNLRSEYARSHDGSGYWIEAAYRLSQVPFWQKALRRTEIVGRGQQLFAGEINEDEAEEYGLPDVNTRQGDFGLNYYLRDGLKASASYSRRLNSDGNVNLWTVGLAYRFALPLGRVGPQ
jgi:hypothetical protein